MLNGGFRGAVSSVLIVVQRFQVFMILVFETHNLSYIIIAILIRASDDLGNRIKLLCTPFSL